MHAFQITQNLNNTTSTCISIANLHLILLTLYLTLRHVLQKNFKDNNQARIVTKFSEKIAEFIHFNHSLKPFYYKLSCSDP